MADPGIPQVGTPPVIVAASPLGGPPQPPQSPVNFSGGVSVDKMVDGASTASKDAASTGLMGMLKEQFDAWKADRADYKEALKDWQLGQKITGYTNLALTTMKEISNTVLQWSAFDAMKTLQTDMEKHKYDLADKALTNDAAKTVAAETITLEKYKLTEKVSAQHEREVTAREKSHNTTVERIASHQRLQQAFFQRRIGGTPVSVLV